MKNRDGRNMRPDDAQDSRIARAVSGDVAALESLLLAHHARLVRLIARRLPLQLQPCVSIEDIAQEVYVVAFRKIAEFDANDGSRFGAWLAAIARRKIGDATRAARTLKRGGEHKTVSPLWDEYGESPVHLLELLAVHSRTPSRSVARREAIAAVEAALARLPQHYSDVLRLRFIEQLGVAQAAERLCRSASAIHMLTHRALRRLCRELGGCCTRTQTDA